ncbi:MAG: hypothetical protein HKN76_17645 [Saprospiraceae bacterium]|nr:hypothetical protein [Saprospiraceae bacterium]
MRLLSSEYKDIVAILASYGIQRADFNLHKKRGWIVIDLPDREKSFSYHRRKSVKIVGNHFEELTAYRISFGGDIEELADWKEVTRAVKKWLSTA